MHIIGFSHHYTKLHDQTYGNLIAVRSTKPLGNRPDPYGLGYDTQYLNPLMLKIWRGEYHLKPRECVPEVLYYPLVITDFDKPLLQLVFIGREKQIPFTTYREFPKNYTPWRKTRTYRKSLPYSDLIGSTFAFKFKGEPLPQGLASKISTRKGGCVKIFD